MRDLHFDFETYCDEDLKLVGIYRYVAHASFRVMTAAWKLDQSLTIRRVVVGQTLPPDLIQLLRHPDVQGHAWNAAFETAVLGKFLISPANPISCTMQRALAYGLPGKLEMAAKALGLPQQKDMVGHRLMLRMTKPLKPGAKPWTLVDQLLLADYCAKDVEAEAAVSEVIPTFWPEEQELSALDAQMNTGGGLHIDPWRVQVLGNVAAVAERDEAARCSKLTAGAVTSPGTQTARLLAWLASRQCGLPDVARTTIEEALTLAAERGDATPDDVVEVLQIRLRAARASLRKLTRMDAMAQFEGALRGQFQFCGAGRTGRWAGRGVQVQNLPRVPKSFDPDLFVAAAEVATVSGTVKGLDAVSPVNLLDGVAWSLRSCLTAGKGLLMWGFDFSQIEARVLAWLAGQQDVLEVFRRGEDVYVWAAEQFGSTNRQLGKVLILALGFGMGATKLRETARKIYGVDLTAAHAEAFKFGWRQRNTKIVSFWTDMQIAAMNAINNRRIVYSVGGSGIAFVCTTKTLQMRLPSGRVLFYHKPRFDRVDVGIVYWGPDAGGGFTEQRTWGGKLAENATQAVARDIMAEAMLRVWRRQGQVPIMTVHDELVYATIHHGSSGMTKAMETLCLESPPWAGGLPIAGEAKVMRRYGVKA